MAKTQSCRLASKPAWSRPSFLPNITSCAPRWLPTRQSHWLPAHSLDTAVTPSLGLHLNQFRLRDSLNLNLFPQTSLFPHLASFVSLVKWKLIREAFPSHPTSTSRTTSLSFPLHYFFFISPESMIDTHLSFVVVLYPPHPTRMCSMTSDFFFYHLHCYIP